MMNIQNIGTSTCTFIPNFDHPLEESIDMLLSVNSCAYPIGDPSFGALVSFGRAKRLYISNAIKSLEFINSKVERPFHLTENLERFEQASDYLVESRDVYIKNLAEENRLLDEFLEEGFFVDMPPAEELEIKAKVVFEDGKPDLSGLEEF